MTAENKRLRAQAVAHHLLHRVDTEEMGPRDGVSVGGCRTDREATTKTEFQNGVTVLEIVVWFVAGGLTALVITPDLGGLIWSLVK